MYSMTDMLARELDERGVPYKRGAFKEVYVYSLGRMWEVVDSERKSYAILLRGYVSLDEALEVVANFTDANVEIDEDGITGHMTCAACGESLERRNRFCPRCGRAIKEHRKTGA